MPISEAARNVAEHATAVAKLELELKTMELKKKAKSFGVGIGLGVGAACSPFFMVAFASRDDRRGVRDVPALVARPLIVTAVCFCSVGLLGLLARNAIKKVRRRSPNRRSVRQSSRRRHSRADATDERQVRKELDAERERLAAAIDELRASIGEEPTSAAS